MTDAELLTAMRTIVREEIHAALKSAPAPMLSPNADRSGFDLRAIALIMGLDIFPSHYSELIDKYKNSGNLPNSMKESMQRFKDWAGTPNGGYAASFSHRAYLDSLADRRNQLKAEGKWPSSKKKANPLSRKALHC